MPTVDEAWALVAGPLEALRADVIDLPDLPWPELRDRFHDELCQLTADRFVDRLVTWLNDMPDTDCQELLASEQLATEVYRQLAEMNAAYDETAWFAYLAENGARWDGTAESWNMFRDWFVYDATRVGFQTPATLLLDHLDQMAPADRVTLFAQYGVTISPPAPTTPLDPRVQKIMDNLLAAQPAYADIPEARRIEMVTALIERKEADT